MPRPPYHTIMVGSLRHLQPFMCHRLFNKPTSCKNRFKRFKPKNDLLVLGDTHISQVNILSFSTHLLPGVKKTKKNILHGTDLERRYCTSTMEISGVLFHDLRIYPCYGGSAHLLSCRYELRYSVDGGSNATYRPGRACDQHSHCCVTTHRAGGLHLPSIPPPPPPPPTNQPCPRNVDPT